MDDYWNKAELDREQARLFSPTLDAMISEDHPVRLFDEIMHGLDWHEWESEYEHRRGQPPIHPRIVASAILYGMKLGIRSIRRLEDACRNRLDFIWLVEGRVIDHSTFCGFRKCFKKQLKSIFRQVCQVAMTMGLVHLVEIAIDGTRVRANNGRSKTATAKTLDQRLSALDEQLEAALAEMEQVDTQETSLFEPGESDNQLPPKLEKLESRRKHLKRALESVHEADEARRKKGGDRAKTPAQTPVTDMDCKVLPNKDGGFAPNYTPMATRDGHRGFVVDVDLINDSSEAPVALAAVDR